MKIYSSPFATPSVTLLSTPEKSLYRTVLELSDYGVNQPVNHLVSGKPCKLSGHQDKNWDTLSGNFVTACRTSAECVGAV
jgi:hypothetical protein